MTINLQKGQRISLKKEAPGLAKVMCGLGWDVKKSSTGLLGVFGGSSDFDLDSSVLCLDSNNRIRNNGDVIYFGNLEHSSRSITHLGDNLTGQGAGDDEQIIVDLSRVPLEITKLVFTVNIYKCLERKQDFNQVNNAFVRLVDLATNQEIARYNLSGGEYQGSTGMILAELDRENEEWKMGAIGREIRVSGLQELVKSYS
jgi:tellurium resistance protein TerD